MKDLRQSKEYGQFLTSQGWIVKKTESDQVFIRRLPLLPVSIIKFQRPTKIDFKQLEKLARQHRALTIYLEPKTIKNNLSSALRQNGYRLCRSTYLPSKTIHLDLTQSEKKILRQMKKDARYCLRKAARAGVNCQQINPSQIAQFRQAWKKAVNRQRYVPSVKTLTSLKNSFGSQALFFATLDTRHQGGHSPKIEEKMITAGLVLLMAENIAYYFYAFTGPLGRRRSAQYQLVWEAIKIAKKNNCRIFDLEGVFDQRFPLKKWRGFSHFKQSFGGLTVEYPGCFVKKNLFFKK